MQVVDVVQLWDLGADPVMRVTIRGGTVKRDDDNKLRTYIVNYELLKVLPVQQIWLAISRSRQVAFVDNRMNLKVPH